MGDNSKNINVTKKTQDIFQNHNCNNNKNMDIQDIELNIHISSISHNKLDTRPKIKDRSKKSINGGVMEQKKKKKDSDQRIKHTRSNISDNTKRKEDPK